MDDRMQKIISLCKRRGFIFQGSEIYGGLRSTYDFGPMGVELKRNLMAEWWRAMVHQRDDIFGLDASIIMHTDVWKASGHLQHFTDPLVECLSCKSRYRADASSCPGCGSVVRGEPRAFNLMFRTSLGPVEDAGSTVYLRPETAQGIFVQYLNVIQSMSPKIPFGIAQMGKSFRNEITTEHFIFRACEFEQMECEYFVRPGEGAGRLTAWVYERLNWWTSLGIKMEHLRLREHAPSELAHYSDGCVDIEYLFPWGWGELEGIASRTDFDLRAHQEASGKNLTFFEPEAQDPTTGKKGWRYLPHVIEPAAGATRGVLAVLCEAYDDSEGDRVVLRLHPRLAPIKVAVLPLVKRDGMPEIAQEVLRSLRLEGITARLDAQHSIGKRYARHDEIGTPFCVTIDGDTHLDGCVTLRLRDDRTQNRVLMTTVPAFIQKALRAS